MIVLVGLMSASAMGSTNTPNIIYIFCDDLGYGDLGSYGNPTILTPHLDQMALEGKRFTQFYAAASVCSPSRASLLTGRYGRRNGTFNNHFHGRISGLDPDEITIAELLSGEGYATTCIGKWHLGHVKQFLPKAQGFDSYFGIPFSNDMRLDPNMPFAEDAVFRDGWTLEKVRSLSFDGSKENQPKGDLVPLIEDDLVIEYPADQSTLTKRYTERAINFIRSNQDQPFFLYMPQTMPHTPLFRSPDFENVSLRGLYGDVIAEIDWSVGQILSTLKELDLDKNTLVVFTSDNGPWLTRNLNGGTQGILRGGKFTQWEGGSRVPAIAWWPGMIDPGIETDMASTLDLFTTAVLLGGAKLPDDRVIDGLDLRGLLLRDEPSPRKELAYYRGDELHAYRYGAWKILLSDQPERGQRPEGYREVPLLYNVEYDPGEVYDLAADYPEKLQVLLKRAEAWKNIE